MHGAPRRQIEWHAVIDPDNGLKALGIDEWPIERRLGCGVNPRTMHPPSHWKRAWDRKNEQLSTIGETPLLLDGFVALRLYTGPMFFKCACALALLGALLFAACALH